MNYTRPALLDRLAAEYVLGTLQGKARIRFEKLKAATPIIAKTVRDWQERTTPLATTVPPVAPSQKVWTGVEQQLGWSQASSPKSRKSIWTWLGGIGSFAFGLLLAIGYIRLYPAEVIPRSVLAEAAPPPKYVGLLNDPAGKPVLFTSSTNTDKQLAVRVMHPVALPAGKVLELWAVPNGAAPIPLGVVPASGKTMVAINESTEFLNGISTLAISIEDGPVHRGASPTQVILTGHCAKLW